MQLAIVAYPRIDEGDRRLIESFRARHDPQAWRIGAHFTLVFPFEALPDDVGLEVAGVVQSTSPIAFAIPRAEVADDPIAGGIVISLVAEEGGAAIVGLHDRLYAGALRRHWRSDIAFVPHITVGRAQDAERAKDLANVLNAGSRVVRGTVADLDLVDVGQPRVQSIRRYTLRHVAETGDRPIGNGAA